MIYLIQDSFTISVSCEFTLVCHSIEQNYQLYIPKKIQSFGEEV
jgi:hypothetical protein